MLVQQQSPELTSTAVDAAFDQIAAGFSDKSTSDAMSEIEALNARFHGSEVPQVIGAIAVDQALTGADPVNLIFDNLSEAHLATRQDELHKLSVHSSRDNYASYAAEAAFYADMHHRMLNLLDEAEPGEDEEDEQIGTWDPIAKTSQRKTKKLAA